jgi:hypothetical protein
MTLKGHIANTGGGKGEVHTGFWWGDLKESYRFEGVGLEGTIILKLIELV